MLKSSIFEVDRTVVFLLQNEGIAPRPIYMPAILLHGMVVVYPIEWRTKAFHNASFLARYHR
jgi:hypothetical protein